MATNDREVWVALASADGNAPELNYLTYAIYSFEKYEWYEQLEKTRGKPPTPSEINEWISQITEIRMRGWRESAARTFDLAARAYMRDYLLNEMQKTTDNTVIDNVRLRMDQFDQSLRAAISDFRKATSFRSQLVVGFVIAMVSPVILGLLILGAQAADMWPTATGIVHMFDSRHATTAIGPRSP